MTPAVRNRVQVLFVKEELGATELEALLNDTMSIDGEVVRIEETVAGGKCADGAARLN
jgi:hypothetical protein